MCENKNTFEILKAEGLTITETMTTPKKQGKQPRPVWNVTGRTQGLEHVFYELGATRYRKGVFSFWNGDPSEEIARQIIEQERLSYTEQKEQEEQRALERADRYNGFSDNALNRAKQRYSAADSISRFIPFGQPVLVGHHSEKRHRRDLSSIERNIYKGVEEQNKSDYYRNKAENILYRENVQKFDPIYLQNRIDEIGAELRKLERNKNWFQDYEIRKNDLTEKLEYYKNQLSFAHEKMKNEGKFIASPETIKKGDFVQYRKTDYYEVIRVNKKSVTIKGWLGVDTMTWTASYSKITGIKK